MTTKKRNKPSRSSTPEDILRETKTTNIHASDNVQLKNGIIADIESLLDEGIQKQIEGLSNPCVLLVGNDTKTKLAACYAHCIRDFNLKRNSVDLLQPESNDTSNLTRFEYRNCFGDDLVTLKKDVEKWLDLFRSGHTIFLSRLKNEDIKVCKQFARELENIRTEKPVNELGLLIIGVGSKCDLPEYLREHFDPPVELEPDNVEVVVTRSTTVSERLKYLGRIATDPDRETEDIETVVVPVVSELEVSLEDKQQEGVVEGKSKNFPLYKKAPKNANWQDLTMAFPNHLEDKVDIIFKCKEKDTVPLRNLGFVDKKATKTFKPLESLILLKQFAKDKNKYSFPLSTGSERGKLYAQVDSLRKVLKQCFGIDGDPVPTIKGGGYRLLFNAYCYDTEEILEVDTFLDSLNGYFSKLSTEASNTGSYRDNDRIKEIVEVIQAIANEIIQRIPGIRIKNAVCTGCYQKVQSYDLNTDTIQMLCNECTPEPSNEYKSKSVVDYKDNDISRSK